MDNRSFVMAAGIVSLLLFTACGKDEPKNNTSPATPSDQVEPANNAQGSSSTASAVALDTGNLNQQSQNMTGYNSTQAGSYGTYNSYSYSQPGAQTQTQAQASRTYVMIRFPKDIVAKAGDNLTLPSQNIPLDALPVTTENIFNTSGQVVVPAGTKVKGSIAVLQGQPSIFNGSAFLAGSRELPFSGAALIPSTPVQAKFDTVGNFIGFTLGGAAVATLISGLTGDRHITTDEVLIGAGAGLVLGTTNYYVNGRDKMVAVGGASLQVQSSMCLNGSAQSCFGQ